MMTELTKEQENQIQFCVDRWLRNQVSTQQYSDKDIYVNKNI